jgi:cytochrome c-type biogenesis protein CcsB
MNKKGVEKLLFLLNSINVIHIKSVILKRKKLIMLKKITNIIYSMKTMAIVTIIFALAMAVATFIENDYGTQTAKALVYNAKWFEVLLFILTINFIGNIFRYKLYRKNKWPVLLFHVAFIIILVGSFVTRYFSYEGIMPIREGATTSKIYSDKTYVKAIVDNNEVMKEFNKEVLFSRIGSNYFEIDETFAPEKSTEIPFTISYLNYLPNIKKVFKKEVNGELILHLVEASRGSRNDIFMKQGDVINVGNILFTFNNPIEGGMNFILNNGGYFLKPVLDGSYMNMSTREQTLVKKDSLTPLQIKKLYSFGSLTFIVSEIEKGKVEYSSASPKEKNMFPYDLVQVKVKSGNEEKIVDLIGTKHSVTKPQKIFLNGLNFTLSYGSKIIEAPFAIKLRDFELERYPGTNSASSYASEVTVISKEETFDYRIYMNHVLDYKGFRFFQSSYDPDEKGTVLSVNHDYWGTLITYIGYFLLAVGMFASLFLKGSRFYSISEKIKKISQSKKVLAVIIFTILSNSVFPQEHQHFDVVKNAVSKEHAEKFGKLLIQDFQGRIKPINTYALESLRKIYKKDTYKGLTAEQVLLGTQINPRAWGYEPIIHVKTNILGKTLSNKLNVKEGLTSMANLYQSGKYFLSDLVNSAFRKNNMDRTGTDKELINLDERANVWYEELNGMMLKIYPKKDDQNNKWYYGYDKIFTGKDSLVSKMHSMYINLLKNAIKTNDYKEADELLDAISTYQKTIAAKIIPPEEKIKLEILYNKLNIFKKLLFYFMILGFVFLITAFIELFNPELKIINYLLKILSLLTILGLIAHAVGLGMRWYISGHEPWSNGYEAVVFVAFVTVLAGLIFSRNKSKFTLASTVLFASFLLGIAHGSMMNPEITNLVPVLKSYWLMIHVAVITASYGFLGLGAVLGFVILLLYILRNKNNAKKLNATINELTYVNESTLTVGLYALTIGTFLGGVWANESWGRYWSWDPKEVWSLISVMVYVIVLHLRLIPNFKGQFIFNVASFFSIATLIMTFFGVNFYLSGMHSYATGDPVPIPIWIYYTITFFIVFSILSYWRYTDYIKSK